MNKTQKLGIAVVAILLLATAGILTAQKRNELGPFGRIIPVLEYKPTDGEIAARQNQVDYLLLRERRAPELLRQFWSKRDFSSSDNYVRSIAPYRELFIADFGMPDELKPGNRNSMISSRFIRSKDGLDYYRWIIRIANTGLEVESLVAVPRQRREPLPVVIAIHGTFGSPEVVLGLSEFRDYHRQFGYFLAREGYVVVAPYINLFGAGEIKEFNQLGRGVGVTQQGLAVAQMIGIMDYLDTQPRYLNSRYGIVGLSYGGALARWTGAIDQRAAVTIDSMGMYDPADVLAMESMLSQFRLEGPRIRNDQIRWTPEYVAGMIAPRAFFIETAKGDPFAPSAARVYDRLQTTYSTLGFPTNVGFQEGGSGHTIYLQDSLNFMKTFLPPAQFRTASRPD
jgi:pimeloyl-ACP methyl ester carboxylesterase